MGRHDGREIGARGLDIVVVPVDTTFGQTLGLILGQDAGTHRHVEPRLLGDERYKLQKTLHNALVGSPHGQHDAELGRSERCRLAGGGEYRFGLQERGRFHGSANREDCAQNGNPRGSPPVFAENSFDLHLGPAPGEPHLVGQRGQRHDCSVG